MKKFLLLFTFLITICFSANAAVSVTNVSNNLEADSVEEVQTTPKKVILVVDQNGVIIDVIVIAAR